MRFVNSMRPEWTISIFHYRNHGADTGRIVIGGSSERFRSQRLESICTKSWLQNWKETDNPAYKLFLGADFN